MKLLPLCAAGLALRTSNPCCASPAAFVRHRWAGRKYMAQFSGRDSFVLAACPDTGAHMPGLVTPQWLEERVDDTDVQVLDIRGEVAKGSVAPDGTQETEYVALYGSYVDGHIPGAAFVDWVKDIAYTDEMGVPVQLLPLDEFVPALESKGVSLKKHVVVYDDGTHLFATRLWWALRLYGHPAVSVLDGGWRRWVAEGRRVSVDAPCPLKIHETWDDGQGTASEKQSFHSHRVEANFVLERCVKAEDAPLQLVDARSAPQYRGEVTRSRRAGHIPGAVNVPYKDLLAEPVTVPETGLSYTPFKSADGINETLARAGVDVSRPTVCSCNGGVASTVVIFALNQLWGTETWNYDGSWNEWSKREDLPVEG